MLAMVRSLSRCELAAARLDGYTRSVSTPEELERLLRNLARFGTLIKDRPYRQVWHFEWNDRRYYLKFYPRRGTLLKRLFRGSPAWREFTNLQLLQKRQVPAPRAVAHFSGYTLQGVKGD